MAVLQGKSIKELVLNKVFGANNSAEERAWEQLIQLLDERINAAERGELSTRTPEQIMQDVLSKKSRP